MGFMPGFCFLHFFKNKTTWYFLQKGYISSLAKLDAVLLKKRNLFKNTYCYGLDF